MCDTLKRDRQLIPACNNIMGSTTTTYTSLYTVNDSINESQPMHFTPQTCEAVHLIKWVQTKWKQVTFWETVGTLTRQERYIIYNKPQRQGKITFSMLIKQKNIFYPTRLSRKVLQILMISWCPTDSVTMIHQNYLSSTAYNFNSFVRTGRL